MKVFVTGASGYIGTVVVPELLKAGHEVIGLARSAESASKIESLGENVRVLRGDLEDLEILKKGASEADGVIHLGFVHDFENFEECCQIDRRATVAMLEALAGSDKCFVYTSGTLGLPSDKLSNESTVHDPNIPTIRSITEDIALTYRDKSVVVTCVRLAPTVHGKGDRGFIPMIMDAARRSEKACYVGLGENVWPAIHRLDTAELYRLVLEKGRAGGVYHGVAEGGIKWKDIAEAMGEVLKVPVVSITPEKAVENFGFLGFFFSRSNPVSNEITRNELGWEPRNLGLLEDLKRNY